MVREGSWSLNEAPQAHPASEELEDADLPTYMPSFEWSRGALEVAIAAGLLLTATVMTMVVSGMAWGDISGHGAVVDVKLEGIEFAGHGLAGGLDWGHQLFDEADGIDQVRLAGTLFAVGKISLFVSLGLLATSVFIRTATITALGSILGTVAIVLVLASTIMFPSGVEGVWEYAASIGEEATGEELPDKVEWGAGLVVAWIGIVAGLAAVILGFAAIRHEDVS